MSKALHPYHYILESQERICLNKQEAVFISFSLKIKFISDPSRISLHPLIFEELLGSLGKVLLV